MNNFMDSEEDSLDSSIPDEFDTKGLEYVLSANSAAEEGHEAVVLANLDGSRGKNQKKKSNVFNVFSESKARCKKPYYETSEESTDVAEHVNTENATMEEGHEGVPAEYKNFRRSGNWTTLPDGREKLMKQIYEFGPGKDRHTATIKTLRDIGVEVMVLDSTKVRTTAEIVDNVRRVVDFVALENRDMGGKGVTGPSRYQRCLLYQDRGGRLFNLVLSKSTAGPAAEWEDNFNSFSGVLAMGTISVLCRSFPCVAEADYVDTFIPAYVLILGLLFTEEISLSWVNASMLVRGMPSVAGHTLTSPIGSDLIRKVLLLCLALASVTSGTIQKVLTFIGIIGICIVLLANLGARAWYTMKFKPIVYNGIGSSFVVYLAAIGTGLVAPYLGHRNVDTGGKSAVEYTLRAAFIVAVVFAVSNINELQKYIVIGSEGCSQDYVNVGFGVWWTITLLISLFLVRQIKNKSKQLVDGEHLLEQCHASPVGYKVPSLPDFEIDTTRAKSGLWCFSPAVEVGAGLIMAVVVGAALFYFGLTAESQNLSYFCSTEMTGGQGGNFNTIGVLENELPEINANGTLEGACNQHCSFLCDDGDMCTIDDYGDCEDNGCRPVELRKKKDCDDGIMCTRDYCSHPFGCFHEPADDLCPESEICDTEYGCLPAVCTTIMTIGNRKKFSTKSVKSTLQALGALDGETQTSLEGSCNQHCAFLCDDGDECTIDDYGDCENNGCRPMELRDKNDCDDGIMCTRDYCLSSSGCHHEPNDNLCPDAEACDTEYGCVPGARSFSVTGIDDPVPNINGQQNQRLGWGYFEFDDRRPGHYTKYNDLDGSDLTFYGEKDTLPYSSIHFDKAIFLPVEQKFQNCDSAPNRPPRQFCFSTKWSYGVANSSDDPTDYMNTAFDQATRFNDDPALETEINAIGFSAARRECDIKNEIGLRWCVMCDKPDGKGGEKWNQGVPVWQYWDGEWVALPDSCGIDTAMSKLAHGVRHDIQICGDIDGKHTTYNTFTLNGSVIDLKSCIPSPIDATRQRSSLAWLSGFIQLYGAKENDAFRVSVYDTELDYIKPRYTLHA